MKFTSVAQAFNYYKDYSIENLDKRALNISAELRTDEKADVDSLNFESMGIEQAKQNLIEKRGTEPFNPVQGGIDNFIVPTDDEVYSTKEYRSAFFKNLLNKPLNENEQKAFDTGRQVFEKRASQFNTVTNSASVIPTQTLNQLIVKAGQEISLIGTVKSFSMPSNIDIPVATPLSKASWHAEGTAVDSEKTSATTVKFKSNEIMKIISISASVSTMSIDAFESYLTDQLVKSVMLTLNDCLVNGDGSGKGKGLESIAWTDGTNSLEYTAPLAYSHFLTALASLKKGYSKNAKWTMNTKTLYSSVFSILDEQKRPIFVQNVNTQDSIGYILGKEVIIDDEVADDVIYLGDNKYLGYNLPGGIAIEVSRESSFKSGLIDYRALAIADTQVIVSEAFFKMVKA